MVKEGPGDGCRACLAKKKRNVTVNVVCWPFFRGESRPPTKVGRVLYGSRRGLCGGKGWTDVKNLVRKYQQPQAGDF